MPNGVELVQYYDEREDEGWRRAVENVLEMSAGAGEDPVRRSVFFRPAGLRGPDGEVHRARRLEVDPGARTTLLLRFHNPHLSDDDVGALTLRALAEDSLRVIVPDRFPRVGELEVPVEVLEGRPQFTIQIGPTPGQHTQVTEQLVPHEIRGRCRARAPRPRRRRAPHRAPRRLRPRPAERHLLARRPGRLLRALPRSPARGAADRRGVGALPPRAGERVARVRAAPDVEKALPA